MADEKFDALVKTLADVKTLVENHVKDSATLDMPKVEKVVKDAIEAERNERVVRKGEPEYVSPVNSPIVKGGVLTSGKYEGKNVRDVALAAWLMTRAHSIMPDKYRKPSDELVKAALTATGAGTGDELVLHGLSPNLWEDVLLDSQIASNLPNKINMPTDPFVLPMGLGDLTWYKGVSVTATTATQLSTGKSTLTCTEQIGEVDWEYDLEEDAIMAVRPIIEARIRKSAAEQIDYFILNADSTDANNINSHDNANATDTKPFLSKGEDGIRHMFQVDNSAMTVDAAGAALSDTHVLSALALMGKYAVNPRDLLMIMDVATYFKGLSNLDGIQTLDKIGNSAVLLTGQVAAYRGIPVVVSSSMHKTEADHFVDDADTGTFGMIAIPNRNMWTVGFKRGITVEADRDIQKRQVMMVISFRIAVASHGGATKSALTHTAGIAHILVA